MKKVESREGALKVIKLLADEGVDLVSAKKILKDADSAIDNVARAMSFNIPMRSISDEVEKCKDNEYLWVP